MKVKIKGLVFVGFAAMIFAANAMADNENTVTSKSFTEATYQHKSTAASIGNTGGTWTAVDTEVTADATSVPTTAAVKDYVDDAIAAVEQGAGTSYQAKSTAADENKVANGTGGWKALNTDIATTTDTGNGATTAAIKTYVTDQLAAQNQLDDDEYQPQATDNLQLGGANGTWADLGTGFANGTYTTKSVDATTGIVTIDANGTTDTTLATDTNKLPTAATVKTYVDNAITQNNTDTAYSSTTTDMITVDAANHTISAVTGTVATGQTGLVNGGQVADAIAAQHTTDNNTYQAKSSAPSIGGNNGTWVAVDTTVSSTGTSVPTTAAVYNAIQNATGSLTIPAQNSSVCTATTPCALVDEAGTLHWRTMATADHAGGVLGDATQGG